MEFRRVLLRSGIAGKCVVGTEEEMEVRFDAESELLHEIADRRVGGEAERLVADKVANMVGAARRRSSFGAMVAHRRQVHPDARTARHGTKDRKSTRLNSSH